MPFPPDVVNRSHAQDLCHFVVIAIAIGLLHPLGTDVVRSQAVRYPHRLDSIGEAQKVVDFRVIGPQSLMAAHHPAIGSSGAKLLGMRRRQPATKRLRNTGIVNDDREPLLTTPAPPIPPRTWEYFREGIALGLPAPITHNPITVRPRHRRLWHHATHHTGHQHHNSRHQRPPAPPIHQASPMPTTQIHQPRDRRRMNRVGEGSGTTLPHTHPVTDNLDHHRSVNLHRLGLIGTHRVIGLQTTQRRNRLRRRHHRRIPGE